MRLHRLRISRGRNGGCVNLKEPFPKVVERACGVKAMTVYLGCYTDSAHPNGLKALCVDETAGRMEVVAEYPVPNALYQTLSPDGAILYSCTGEGLASFEGTGNGGL